ncbi:MAG: hypothetical protein ACRDYA_24335 [Egibacteraceae bacterium]
MPCCRLYPLEHAAHAVQLNVQQDGRVASIPTDLAAGALFERDHAQQFPDR